MHLNSSTELHMISNICELQVFVFTPRHWLDLLKLLDLFELLHTLDAEFRDTANLQGLYGCAALRFSTTVESSENCKSNHELARKDENSSMWSEKWSETWTYNRWFTMWRLTMHHVDHLEAQKSHRGDFTGSSNWLTVTYDSEVIGTDKSSAQPFVPLSTLIPLLPPPLRTPSRSATAGGLW